MQKIKEIWKSILGFEDSYEISNYGRVKSKCRFLLYKVDFNYRKRVIQERILKHGITPNGYPVVVLSRQGKFHYRYVHDLVLRAFIGPKRNKICRHLDDNSLNNHISNLCYGTYKENYADAKKHNLINYCCGIKSPFAKLTEAQIRIIRSNKKYSFRMLGRKYGVTHGRIADIIYRRGWKHIK